MANTTTLTFDVTEQTLELVTDTRVASGGLKDIILKFNFTDNTWDGLSLKAVFKSSIDDTAYSVDVLSNEAIVPHEVMREKCTVYVGLAGSIVNGQGEATLVRTTAVYGLKLERGTPVSFEPSTEEDRYWASVAEMWATGGSGGTPSATNNAKYYSEQSASSAFDSEESAERADESAQDAWDYANSVNPEKLVHKESNTEDTTFDFGDQFVRKDSAEQSEHAIPEMFPEDDERTMMSMLRESSDAGYFLFVCSTIPASSGASGIKGQIAFDTNNGYVYVCVADNTWKRFTMSDF